MSLEGGAPSAVVAMHCPHLLRLPPCIIMHSLYSNTVAGCRPSCRKVLPMLIRVVLRNDQGLLDFLLVARSRDGGGFVMWPSQCGMRNVWPRSGSSL